MSNLRTAAQQALEALEYAQQDRECPSTTRQAITALKAALAEPVQEPVAWISESENLLSWDKFYDHMKPLYTAPPQRKPLTEEEISNLWSWSMTVEAERTATTQQHAFARAIERAHGIGGQNESA